VNFEACQTCPRFASCWRSERELSCFLTHIRNWNWNTAIAGVLFAFVWLSAGMKFLSGTDSRKSGTVIVIISPLNNSLINERGYMCAEPQSAHTICVFQYKCIRYGEASLSHIETHHQSRVRSILMPLDATLYKFYGFPSRLTVSVSHVPSRRWRCFVIRRHDSNTPSPVISRRDESIAHTSLDFLFTLWCTYADVERTPRRESVWCNCERHVCRDVCVSCDARDGTRTPTVSIANYEISSAGDLYPWADLPVSSLSSARIER